MAAAGVVRRQHRARDEDARHADARVVGVDRVAALRDAALVEADVGQQPAVGDGQVGRLVGGLGVHQIDRLEIVGQPVLVVADPQPAVGGDFGRGGQAGAAAVQRILGQRLHAVQHQQVVEVDLGAVGHALQLFDILRHAFLGEGQVLARVQGRLAPASDAQPLRFGLEVATVGRQHGVDDHAPMLADLPAHLAMRSLHTDDGHRLLAEAGMRVVFWCGEKGLGSTAISGGLGVQRCKRDEYLSRLYPQRRTAGKGKLDVTAIRRLVDETISAVKIVGQHSSSAVEALRSRQSGREGSAGRNSGRARGYDCA